MSGLSGGQRKDGLLTKTWTGQLGDDIVAWKLERDVAGVKDTDGSCKLLLGHVEVFHDALQLCSREVVPIDVCNEQRACGVRGLGHAATYSSGCIGPYLFVSRAQLDATRHT